MEQNWQIEKTLPCRQYRLVPGLQELHTDRSGAKQYFRAGRELPFNPEIRDEDLLAVVPGMVPNENSMILVRFQKQFRILYYHRKGGDEVLSDDQGQVVIRECLPGDSLQILGTVTSVIHPVCTEREKVCRSADFSLVFPQWITDLELECLDTCYETEEKKLRLAFCLAERNVLYGTGGPFGAAVFAAGTGKVIAMAVNTVVTQQQSFAHAEMMAIAKAQHRLRTLDLSGYELVSSCEPCAMCAGGILWSGLDRVIYGAPGNSARGIGFDEGDKIPDWKQAYAARNIRITGPLLEKEAQEAFDLYEKKGGRIY